MIRRSTVLAGLAATVLAPASARAAASATPLTGARRSTLEQFLSALQAERFDRAFALLSAKERQYFGTAANYGSIFAADHLKLIKFAIAAAHPAPGGVLATVEESIEFYDYTHQAPVDATVRVAYGLLDEAGATRVKDPYHPWRALAPADAAVTTQGMRATVRKVSFFTGYVEFVVSFANVGDNGATVLPYGRSVLRDDKGGVYHPIVSRVDQLTDRQFRLGLVLPAAAQYTGTMTFFTPNRFVPASLAVTIAPVLRDGGDEPFTLEVPPIPVPAG